MAKFSELCIRDELGLTVFDNRVETSVIVPFACYEANISNNLPIAAVQFCAAVIGYYSMLHIALRTLRYNLPNLTYPSKCSYASLFPIPPINECNSTTIAIRLQLQFDYKCNKSITQMQLGTRLKNAYSATNKLHSILFDTVPGFAR